MSPATVQVNSSSKFPSPGFNAGARPYRSHKVRACDLCRKRKSRCTVDIPGQSCLLCRVQGADCHYQEEANADVSVLSAPDTKPWQGPQVPMLFPDRSASAVPMDQRTRLRMSRPVNQYGPSPHGTTSSGGRRGSDSRRKEWMILRMSRFSSSGLWLQKMHKSLRSICPPSGPVNRKNPRVTHTTSTRATHGSQFFTPQSHGGGRVCASRNSSRRESKGSIGTNPRTIQTRSSETVCS